MNIDKNDILIILPLIALLLIGIIMVTSSSIYIADNNKSNPFYFAQMQSLFIAIGILAMIFFLILPSNFLYRTDWIFMLISIILLIALFFTRCWNKR